jgi:hypothetical protein
MVVIGALHRAGRHDAGADRLAVDVDRAGAALGDPAAEFRAGQAELVAQHPEQRRIRLDVDLMAASVDREREHPEAPCAVRRC